MVICSKKEQFKTDIERGVRAWMLAFTANLMISRNKLIFINKILWGQVSATNAKK